MKCNIDTKDDGCGRRHEAWLRAELASRRGYADAYRLRFAVFVLWVLLMAALVWWGVCLAWEPFCAFQAREQERMGAEDEGLRAAYDAEMVDGVLRGARLRDNGQAVDASAWRVASEAPATRKGDGR